MLELNGVASILHGISILYWIVAVVALISVLWWVRRWWAKLIGALVVIGLFGFLPAKGLIDAKEREAYTREAWAYFKKLCAEKSGQISHEMTSDDSSSCRHPCRHLVRLR